MSVGGLGALALGALLAAGCASRVIADPPVPAPAMAPVSAAADTVSRLDGLRTALDGILTHDSFARAQTALVVRSLTTNETLYRRNGATWLVPASTMKVLTAVAAAERLGWGFRFQTRLLAMGPIANGVLQGDLLVVGGGDPTINPRHPSRAAAFDEWATALRARGIRRIAGHIVGDDSAVEQPGWGIGWAWDDLVEGYGAAYGALQVNEGEVTVTIGPSTTPGSPAVLYLSPSNHGLLVDNRAVTGAAGSPAALRLKRDPGTRFLEVHGSVPWDGVPVSAVTAVANPTLYFTSELRAALQRRGIEVDGAAADIDEISDRPRAADGEVLLTDLSAPLSAVADVALKWSRNEHAEAMLLALDATAPATAAEAVPVLRETLAGLGVAPGGYSTRDGSGLSRNDYLSADALIETLTGVWHRPALRDDLRAALPQAGRSGSLAGRLVGTAADGRVWAKTGSMSNVRSLAGYVETTTGETLVFAFLTNGFDVRPSAIDAQVDAVLLTLVDLPR